LEEVGCFRGPVYEFVVAVLPFLLLLRWGAVVRAEIGFVQDGGMTRVGMLAALFSPILLVLLEEFLTMIL